MVISNPIDSILFKLLSVSVAAKWMLPSDLLTCSLLNDYTSIEFCGFKSVKYLKYLPYLSERCRLPWHLNVKVTCAVPIADNRISLWGKISPM